jgi:hypothetical protein
MAQAVLPPIDGNRYGSDVCDAVRVMRSEKDAVKSVEPNLSCSLLDAIDIFLDGRKDTQLHFACFQFMEPLSWALVRVVVVAKPCLVLPRQDNAGSPLLPSSRHGRMMVSRYPGLSPGESEFQKQSIKCWIRCRTSSERYCCCVWVVLICWVWRRRDASSLAGIEQALMKGTLPFIPDGGTNV